MFKYEKLYTVLYSIYFAIMLSRIKSIVFLQATLIEKIGWCFLLTSIALGLAIGISKIMGNIRNKTVAKIDSKTDNKEK